MRLEIQGFRSETGTNPFCRPIAFYPAGVLFDTSNNAHLLEKVGVRQLVTGVIDELVELASAHGCSFSGDFRQRIIEKMVAPDSPNTMYQDYQSRRPMEFETYLGSPIKLAAESGIRVPRIETLYAMLHHANTLNLSRPRQGDSPPPVLAQPPPPRMSSAPPQKPPMNGNMRGARSSSGLMPPRRGPPVPSMSRPPSAQPPSAAARMPREPSLEDLGEFSHLVVYDELENGQNGYPDMAGAHAPPHPPPTPSAAELSLRERELALRQRELTVREHETRMRGPPPPRRAPPRSTFDEDDGEDLFDSTDSLPAVPQIDPDNVDMMSLTSRKARRTPNPSQVRRNPEINLNNRPASGFSRYFGGGGRKRTSDRIMQEIPGLHESLMDNPMMGYSSNRFGAVDRNQMHAGSRTNSMTTTRMGDAPPYPYPPSRRNSHSPAAPFPGPRMGRPITADQSLGPPPPGGPHGGHPSPPGNMRAPVPRYPPGHGNAMGPQQVEQHYGVSNPYSNKGTPKHRSLTGSASASAESGDSGASANIDPGNSAHSSQISLGRHQATMPIR